MYHHFPDKHALGYAVLDEETKKFVLEFRQRVNQINDPDIHYATFRLDDGQTFVHIASFASADK